MTSGLDSLKKFAPWFWLAARVFVGLVFAYAGFSKLSEPIANFRGVIAQYEIIPYAFVPAIAHVLPWIELIFGVFVILGYWPKPSCFVLACLSFGFLTLLGSSKLILGEVPVSCGCFGENSLIHLTVRQVFLLDTVNFFLSLKLAFIPRHLWSLDGFLRSS